MSARYMLVIPMNGFNDQMCVIGQCILYCRKFKRIMLLLWKFGDVVQVCEQNEHFIIDDDAQINKIVSNTDLSVYPSFFQGRPLYASECELGNINGYHTFKEASVNSYLPLNQDYDEDLIIHRCPRYPEDINYNVRYRCGSSIEAIPLFTLTDEATKEFTRRRQLLPRAYHSVHIRNTDMVTDLKRFMMNRHAILIQNPLFLATDSAEALEMVRKKNPRVLFIEKKFPDGNVPLHTSEKHNNLDMICDLLLLANGKSVTLSRYTGYGVLSRWLQEHQSILRNFQGCTA